MIALLGILSILALAALCSDNRRRIPLRTVGFALCLQVLFAALVLWLPAGQQVLNGVSESVSSVSSVIGYGQEGIAFLFGDLAKFKLGFIFAFNVLPVIIFFSALIAILYHIGHPRRPCHQYRCQQRWRVHPAQGFQLWRQPAHGDGAPQVKP